MGLLTDPYGLTVGFPHWLLNMSLPAGNRAPIAVGDSAVVQRWDGPVTLDVMTNDVDPDGDVLTLIGADAVYGQAVAEPDGTITYTPPSGSEASDTITYTIADPDGAQSVGMVDVTLEGTLVSVSPNSSNYIVVDAQDGFVEITVSAPQVFAGTYLVNLEDLSVGPISLLDPVITGLAEEDEGLSAHALWVYDEANAAPLITFQWVRDGVAINGATAQTYTVMATDAGAALSVTSTATDANGSRSAASAAVSVAGAVDADSYTNANPLYSAHGGSRLRWKDYTLEGFTDEITRGVTGIDSDVRLLSDDGLAVIHNADVSTQTSGTGQVSSFDTAGWEALDVDFHPNMPGTTTPKAITHDALTAAFANTVVYTPETKVAGAAAPLVADLLAAGINGKNAVVGSFRLSDLTGPGKAVEAGYETLLLVSGGTGSIASAQAAGVGWVGLNSAVSAGDVTAWANAGFKIMFWTVDRRYRSAQLLALDTQVVGFWSDDAAYLQGAGTVTQDTWDTGKWMPGMLHQSEPLDSGNSVGNRAATHRGTIMAGGYFGWETSQNQKDFVLQGWATAPEDTASDDFEIDLTVRYDAADSAARWMAVALHDASMGDRGFTDAGSAEQQGYNILFRKDGRVQIYRRSAGAVANIATYNGAAFANGDTANYKITVTPAMIRVDKMDGQTVLGSATTTDTTGRGGYFSLGRFGMSGAFKDVTVLRN